ncbi:MAG: ABC transporter ATP-binding protein [Cellulomonas iranensis]|uniref:ABC transporter transmembrane domain-containing protein n=1 Tax=Cellulomonas iranensis TaxID=76862 RepID=UPI001B1D22E2|nr:ABC transporter ATP-binding protein [Cellulomonas iranensis]MBO9568316.1 ABC transporter ATP-binding protein [Cellulomonas iranensis]
MPAPVSAPPTRARDTAPAATASATPWTVRRVAAHALLAAGRRARLAVSTTGLVLHEVAEALVPVLVGAVIDHAVLPRDGRALGLLLGALVTVFVVLSWSWRFGALAATHVTAHGEHDLRVLGVRRVLAHHGTARPRAAGEVDAVLTSDTGQVSGTSWAVGELVAALAALAVSAVAMVHASPALGVGVLVVTPALLVALHHLSRPLDARTGAAQQSAARTVGAAADMLTGLRVLTGIGARPAAAARYRTLSRAALAAALHAARARVAFTGVSSLLSGLVLAGVALAAGLVALDGGMTLGQMVTVVGLAQYVQRPMDAVGWVLVDLAARRASARRIAALLEDAPLHPAPGAAAGAAPDPSHPVAVEVTPGATTADGTPLPALRVARREVVGVAGDAVRTRALVEALAGRTRVAPGVRVLGADVAALDPRTLRDVVHAPPHDVALVTAPLADVLTAGAPGTTPDPDVLHATTVGEVLEHLPDGLATVLDGAGARLSGGQRQRVALARAWATPHAVLVLHEPTTALDAVTEQHVARELTALHARRGDDRAVVLVTSSATLLAACDRVVVVHADGTDTGRHADLLARVPSYRELVA